MNKKMKILTGIIAAASILVTGFPVLAASPAGSIKGSDVIYTADAVTTDKLAITIDGSFEDWSDKPVYELFWSESTKHHVQIFRDDTYVYLHIRMSDSGYAKFNGYGYCFNFDNKDHFVDVVAVSGPTVNGINAFEIRRREGNKLIDDAPAYVTHTEGQPDECELKIPLRFFDPHPERVTSITFTCDNLGSQSVEFEGTSTGPYIIAGAGLVLAAAGIFAFTKKRKIRT